MNKEAMNLKEGKKGYMECLEGGQGIEKWYNYIIISKIIFKKKINTQAFKGGGEIEKGFGFREYE